MIRIARTSSSDKHFSSLIDLLDSELNERNGELQKNYSQYNIIEQNNTVIVAFDGDKPVGCGCFKHYSQDSVEIKRMFVIKGYRGKGISKLILNELELWAIEEGFKNSILETGIKQNEAIGLYTKAGYHKIENYGQYAGNANSVCMMKNLILG